MNSFAILLIAISVYTGVTADQFVGTGSTTNSVDLGTAEVAGTLSAANVGVGLTNAQVLDALTISGGSVNATPIGFYSPSTGKFTTLQSTGLFTTAASTASAAGLNIALGTPPTTPNAGDLWPTTGGFYGCVVAGTAIGPFLTSTSTISLDDDVNLRFGDGVDYQWRFNGTALQLRDASGNSLGTWTDAGTTGNLSITGTVAASNIGTLAAQASDSVNIDGGAIDGTIIGGTTPAALAATTGTFSGALAGTTGTFSGAVAGTTGTFSGALAATTGTFSGAISATTFTGAIAGTTGTFSGNATFGGTLSVDDFDVSDTGTAYVMTDGTNTMFTVTDAGTTGNVAVSGTLAVAGTSALVGDATLTGDIYVNGADVKSTALTVQLFDATTTKINLGGAAAIDAGVSGKLLTVKGTANFDEAVSFDAAVTIASTLRSTTANYRRYYHLGANSLAEGGGVGAPVWTQASANNVAGWQLDAANEELECVVDIHSDWDGDSDLSAEAYFTLNAAGNAGDTVEIDMVSYYIGEGETGGVANSPKTQSETVSTVTDGTQYKTYKADFTINWDEADNVVEAGDVISVKFNLNVGLSEIDDIIFSHATFYYGTTHVGIESGDV